jgi:hypothetical protein
MKSPRRFNGRKRIHDADEILAKIVAKRLVEHLEQSGFVVLKRPGEAVRRYGEDSRANDIGVRNTRVRAWLY